MQLGTAAVAVAQAVSRHVLKAGHQVILSNGHGPDSLEALISELGSGASTGTAAEAAAADMVLLAVPWDRGFRLNGTDVGTPGAISRFSGVESAGQH